MSESKSDDGVNETRRTADQPVPDTRAPEAGSKPAAGVVSPAEKSEPEGVPVQEHRHHPDPNAPLQEVTKPGETSLPEDESGGIPLSSRQDLPDLGTDEARLRAQVRYSEPPEDAGEGTSEQGNDPNELPREDDR